MRTMYLFFALPYFCVVLFRLPLILMTIAYTQIVRVLWKSDTIPGHRESRNQTYMCGCKYLRFIVFHTARFCVYCTLLTQLAFNIKLIQLICVMCISCTCKIVAVLYFLLIRTMHMDN